MPTRSAASFRVQKNKKRPKPIPTEEYPSEEKRGSDVTSVPSSRTLVLSLSAQHVRSVCLEAFACSAHVLRQSEAADHKICKLQLCILVVRLTRQKRMEDDGGKRYGGE